MEAVCQQVINSGGGQRGRSAKIESVRRGGRMRRAKILQMQELGFKDVAANSCS